MKFSIGMRCNKCSALNTIFGNGAIKLTCLCGNRLAVIEGSKLKSKILGINGLQLDRIMVNAEGEIHGHVAG